MADLAEFPRRRCLDLAAEDTAARALVMALSAVSDRLDRIIELHHAPARGPCTASRQLTADVPLTCTLPDGHTGGHLDPRGGSRWFHR